MNIFFTASLRGKQKYGRNYKQIYAELSKNHIVFAKHLFDYNIDTVHGWDPEYRFDYYQDAINKIRFCDLLVAELTISTINVIYEIAIALELKKNVVVLYAGDSLPKFIEEIDIKLTENKIQTINYTKENLANQLKTVLNSARKMIAQRFTILLPTHIINYLDAVSKEIRIPRAVYIRQLIEKNMEINKI